MNRDSPAFLLGTLEADHGMRAKQIEGTTYFKPNSTRF
jgi:hypothetical protein